MSPEARCAVAYIVGRVASGVQAISIFDADRAVHVPLSGTVTGGEISVYDAGRGHFITGSRSGDRTLLHDLNDDSHVELSVESGGTFSGLHRESGWRFNGSTCGSNIRVFDAETAADYNYSL